MMKAVRIAVITSEGLVKGRVRDSGRIIGELEQANVNKVKVNKKVSKLIRDLVLNKK